MREMGLEPTRHNHTHLKRACLPFQHSRERLNSITEIPAFVNPFFRNREMLQKNYPVINLSGQIDFHTLFRYSEENKIRKEKVYVLESLFYQFAHCQS